MKQLAHIRRSHGRHWVGDGFPVRTIFSYHDLAEAMSPFLLLDYAGPAHFEPTGERRGVGAHPHRGFETVTIVYDGGVSHRDTSGAGGTIGRGDVQWMTAGSGLLHEEFHSDDYAQSGGPFEMVQLWVNLPARDKMVAPAYQSITSDRIPEISLPYQAGIARIIAGRYGETTGAARTFTPMNVWDMRLEARKKVSIELPAGHTTALFVLSGAIRVNGQLVGAAELAVLERESAQLVFETVEKSVVLLLGGEPLNEPVAGHGPFVMNTREEIEQALHDLKVGRFGRMPRQD